MHSTPTATHYDYRFGETDLWEDALRPKAQRYLGLMILGLLLVMSAGLALMFAPRLTAATQNLRTNAALSIVTGTPRPTLSLPTVTPGPPTDTPTRTPPPSATFTLTPTPEPCRQQVQPEDGLYAIVIRCGHRDLFVLTEVIRTNNLNNDTDIRPGQFIEVPWPTPTIDPNATLTPSPTVDITQVAALTSGGDAAGDTVVVDLNATLLADPFFQIEPTLPPGVMYHFVRADDNAIIISELYNTNVEVLDQLNPEITFSQCDYGERFGGPRCTIPLSIGQRVRVPAPTPTPTLSPTPSGSETATPTATATFNAPSSVSPSNRAFLRRDEVVTLRWNASGVLGANQAYRVIVERVNDGLTFVADTQDLFLRLPPEWQGETGERFEYVWTVSIVTLDNPQQLNHTTLPLAFTWEGRGLASPEGGEENS
jgi:hypothetical protein